MSLSIPPEILKKLDLSSNKRENEIMKLFEVVQELIDTCQQKEDRINLLRIHLRKAVVELHNLMQTKEDLINTNKKLSKNTNSVLFIL